MYLQMVPILGKYVYYGCYCFTNAQYDLDAGYGKAVDEIDRSCKAIGLLDYTYRVYVEVNVRYHVIT